MHNNIKYLDALKVRKLHYVHSVLTFGNTTYKVWLGNSRNDFIASIPVSLQLNERGHL